MIHEILGAPVAGLRSSLSSCNDGSAVVFIVADAPAVLSRACGTKESRATVETNGRLCLPWSVVLDDGQKLCDCGSYATAERAFKRMQLIAA